MCALALVAVVAVAQKPAPEYVKRGTRAETVTATLEKAGSPTMEGKWFIVGPFDNADNQAFDGELPPEKKVDLKAEYAGKKGEKIGWKEYAGFKFGRILNLALVYKDSLHSACYLYHEFENKTGERLLWPLYLGSDDTLTVFFNGKRLIHENYSRPAAPDQDLIELPVVPGKNQILIKICNAAAGWELYAQPGLPKQLPAAIGQKLAKDFPVTGGQSPAAANNSAEAEHYAIETVPLPEGCVLEVGGLAFRPDGKLLACTRRGEIWLIHNPLAPIAEIKMTLFASGLHEALGIQAEDDKTVIVVQRPELTKLIDNDGDGKADEFTTICDKWGCSGDYHEFAFGPAKGKDGHYYVNLNVGFGFGDQGKAPWRGWCVKVSPDGELEPFACGIRSPNGINWSPDGELFYTDNQGEWVASNKLNHLRKGEYYGHQASLKWIKDSPFAGKMPDKVLSGMNYDGSAAKKGGPEGMPKVDPPCVWFPYNRMGGSITEPVWDTTSGRFGPFAGQMFVGDQKTSVVMRVSLEKVNGRYQGVCFPFRSGFQSGCNRLAFGPDGKSLFVGQTARGWGSLGGKQYGLQRLVYTGKPPLEVETVKITKSGFDVVFTKPVVAPKKLDEAASVKSFTYTYFGNYGCPEIDPRVEKVSATKLSADGKTLSFDVAGRRPGRVYDMHFTDISTEDGEKLLHEDAYYTLNEIP